MSIFDELSNYFEKTVSNMEKIPGFDSSILTFPEKEQLGQLLENINTSSSNLIKEEDKAKLSEYFSKITTAVQGASESVAGNIQKIPEQEKLEEILKNMSQGINIPQDDKQKLSDFFSKYTSLIPGVYNGNLLTMPDQEKLAEILEKMSKGVTLDTEDKSKFDEILKTMSIPISKPSDTCNESTQQSQSQSQPESQPPVKKKAGILAYIIGKIVYFIMIPIKMLMKLLNQPVKAIELAKPSKKKIDPDTHKTKKVKLYFKALHATNVFPGILTILITLYLIIFLLWTAIQGFFRWISAGSINLPNFPFSFDKTMTQIVYSFFYLVTSIYLIVYF